MIKISICIVSFCRPGSLERLLKSLEAMIYPNTTVLEIVVIDNDLLATAREVVFRFRNAKIPVRYFVEPKQNISIARNRAVREANGDWIAFVDDDEIVAAEWLQSYVFMNHNYEADGFFGPVLSLIDESLPDWMDLEMLSRSRATDIVEIIPSDLRTGNCFLQRSRLLEHGFDQQFGLTGGEDVELFERMISAGAKFLWCRDAVTYECYSRNRIRLSWLVQRSFRGGYSHTLVRKKQKPQISNQIATGIKALVGSILFSGALPIVFFSGRLYLVKTLLRLMVQLGHLWALIGFNYEEYSRKRVVRHSQI